MRISLSKKKKKQRTKNTLDKRHTDLEQCAPYVNISERNFIFLGIVTSCFFQQSTQQCEKDTIFSNLKCGNFLASCAARLKELVPITLKKEMML